MTGYGIPLTKNSRYKEMIDRKVIEFIHSGELERIQNYWFTGSCKNKKEDNNSDGLGVPQSISVFILLQIGILLSFIAFCGHHFYANHLKKKIKTLLFNDDANVLSKEAAPMNQKKHDETVACLDYSCRNQSCQQEINSLRKRLEFLEKCAANAGKDSIVANQIELKRVSSECLLVVDSFGMESLELKNFYKKRLEFETNV